VFERFTERARKVVFYAQEEARTLKHDYIGTEHILLGLLLEQEGLAARFLGSLEITAQRARGEVIRLVAPGEERPGHLDRIPFTPGAKKTLERALREALSLGHNYIGTEHILLGLVHENEGVAIDILLGFGANSEMVRHGVIGMLSRPGGPMRVMHDLDRSWLDFTPTEAFDLARRLASMSSEIKFEVRLHTGEEPTFRVSCQLLGNDDVLRELVALEAAGIRAVLDRGRTAKLGHLDWPVEPDTAR